MSITDDERAKSYLIELNQEMVHKEQEGEASRKYFEPLLSDKLLFHRASGKVDGKSGFLDGLKNNPFESREPLEVTPILQGDQALVTLIVVGTRKDDHTEHRYRNIRLFSRSSGTWILEFWYNYEIPGQ